MSGYIGLEIGGSGGVEGRCEVASPMNNAQCILPAGHVGDHEAPGAGSGTPHECPDCGGPMAEFKVDAPNEEMALRVFLAYYATTVFSPQDLKDVTDGKKHLHIADKGSCTE